jgi:hypothetical protein
MITHSIPPPFLFIKLNLFKRLNTSGGSNDPLRTEVVWKKKSNIFVQPENEMTG